MTTDITELAQSLKAAAEKATSGEWAVQFGDEVYVTNDDVGYEQVAIATLDARDADYIALANPANILALEKAQRHANLTEAERQAYLGLISKRDERIAELESRTVKMPEPFKLAKSSSGLTYYYADEVNEALSAAGIKWEAE